METGFISTGGYSYPGTNPTTFTGLEPTNHPAKGNTNGTAQFMATFRASLHSLGDFPDKYIINKLTQQAGVQKQLASSISGLIEGMIADSRVNWERKLPLCYLVDSVLKNIGEPYVALFGSGVTTWFFRAYDAVGMTEKRSLVRVLGTWEKQSMFPSDILQVLRSHVSMAPHGSATTTTTTLEEPSPSTTVMPLQSQPLGTTPKRAGAPALAASVVAPQPAAPIPHAAAAQQQQTPADGATQSSATTPLPTILRLNQTVASGNVLPAAGSTEFHTEVDKLTAELVEEQQEVLGRAKSMSTEELWRAQPDLAMEFRTFAETQLAEEIRRLSTGGAIISVPDTAVPLAAAAVPKPLSPVLGKEVSGLVEATTEKGRSSVKRQAAVSVVVGDGGVMTGNRGHKAPRIRQNGCDVDLSKAEQVAEKLLREVGIAASSAGAGETSASQRHTALATKHVSALAGMLGLGLDLRDGMKTGSFGGGSARGSAPQLAGWLKNSLLRKWDGHIRALYKDVTFHCKQDGQRFMTQALLDQHMDLLFRRRRAKKENTTASRSWYPMTEQWITDFGASSVEKNGEKNKPIAGNGTTTDPSADLLEQVALEALGGKMGKEDSSGTETDKTDGLKLVDGPPVLADEYNGICKICGEAFDMFFSTEEEEWMFKDACCVDVPPRVIVHKACLDEAGVSTLRDLLVQQQSSSPTGSGVEEGKVLSNSNPPRVSVSQDELGGGGTV